MPGYSNAPCLSSLPRSRQKDLFGVFTVYVLQSDRTGNLYIGQTENLAKRLDEHNQGISRYTKGRGPWTLVYSEERSTRSEAMIRERQLKGGQGREWLRDLLSDANDSLSN